MPNFEASFRPPMTRAKKAKPAATNPPFWKRITPGEWAGIALTILGIAAAAYFAWPSYRADKRQNEQYEAEQAAKKASFPCPDCQEFPVQFVQDTLYVLITRFEDLQPKDGLECYGRGIERRIDELAQARKLAIRFCYCDALSPSQSREADRLRDQFRADLIIWGKLSNADADCNADGFCLQFNPSDTLIRYVGGEIPRPKLDDIQEDVSARDVEQGLINMGKERFDDWLIGMFNLKIGKQKPELFVIDAAWSKEKKQKEYFTRANTWAEIGNHDKAISDYNVCIALDPKDARAYNKRGFSKYNLGRYAEAISDFDQVIALDPKEARTYNNRGVSKRTLGRYAEAILDYDQAIALDPKYAMAYNNRGNAKQGLGRYAEAIQDYDQAITLDPKYAMAYNNRGISKGNLGRYAEAIQDYDQAIALDPTDATAYNNRGISKNNLGRYVEAVQDYNQAIALDPKYAAAYNNRGISKQGLGRYAEAIQDFDQAIALNPKNALAYNNRGISKNNLGRYAEAIQDYDQAIALDPKDATAYNNRGNSKHLLGRYAEAIQDYDQAIALG
jgi:tetratricopeptide (TPR) repeat protein